MTDPVSAVLVVEDDPAMLRLIRRTLEINGHTVVTAVDGPEAIDQFQRRNPDLVVLDIGLPGLDGLEVCQRLQEIRHHPMVLLITRGPALGPVKLDPQNPRLLGLVQ